MSPLFSFPGRSRLVAVMVAVAAAALISPMAAPPAGTADTVAVAKVSSAAAQPAFDAGVGASRAEAADAKVLKDKAEAREAAATVLAQEEQEAAAAAEQDRLAQAEQEAAAAEARAAAEQTKAAQEALATRVINVGYAGGQDVVDMGVGPVLFPLPGNWPPYVAEHDFHGGWDRIGTLTPGMKVTMTGLVAGSYTVGEMIHVPRGGRTSDLAFSVMPQVMLQTCIPGTEMMLVVGLY